MGNLPSPVYAGDAVVIDKKVYIVVGTIEGVLSDKLYLPISALYPRWQQEWGTA